MHFLVNFIEKKGNHYIFTKISIEGGKNMKKIKPVIQKDLKDCGVSCMQWIIMYYDGFISIEKLRDDTFTDSRGTSAYHIVEAFKKWNFDSYGVLEHDLTKKELRFPLIAHLKLENGLEHFVVVKNIIKNTIYIMDPSIGDNKLTINEFNKLFSGYIILVYPRGNIIKMDKGLTIGNLFFNILNKEKFLIIKIIITSILWTILSIISSYYLKISSVLINEDIILIKILISIFFILIILKIFSLFVREYYKNHLSNLVDVYLYPWFIKHLFFLPLKNINSRTSGEIMTRIDELGNLKSLFSDIFVSCFLDSIMIIISIIILYLLNNELTIILLLFILFYIMVGIIFSKITYKKVLENINFQTDFNSKVLESVEMIESIKHLNIINTFLEKIEYVLSKCILFNYKFNNFFNISNLTKDFLLEMCFFFVNSYGLFKVINGDINIIDLFTFNLLLSYCLDPVQNIIALLPKFNYIKASFNKIMEFINVEEEKLNEETKILNGDIILKNVSYSYNNYDYIIKDINLKIKDKSHILLNGKSGCGKSTICKILCKEYELTNGEVYIDGKNIKDINLSTIRNNILYISQKEKLFFGTIKENIIVGRKINNYLFDKVCQICKIEDIVSKKEMRYDALLEPSFSNLSGGEMQRIILARGLLKNSNIIILDEALSEVDKKLEGEIIKNIRKFYKEKTIIYISHKNQRNNFENIIDIGENYGILSG